MLIILGRTIPQVRVECIYSSVLNHIIYYKNVSKMTEFYIGPWLGIRNIEKNKPVRRSA